jgi:2'-5' RNA ligase
MRRSPMLAVRMSMDGTHKFSSTHIDMMDVGRGVSFNKYLKQMAASIPDEELAEDGRETDFHITVKYGLHTQDADEVRQIVEGFGPVRYSLGKSSIFPASKEHPFDVVKIDVESEGLHRLNALLSDSLECTDTHPEYHPHVTLAYVKTGEGEKYVGAFDFGGSSNTAWNLVFSDKDGNETEIPLRASKATRLGWTTDPSWSDPTGGKRQAWRNKESGETRYQVTMPGSAPQAATAVPPAGQPKAPAQPTQSAGGTSGTVGATPKPTSPSSAGQSQPLVKPVTGKLETAFDRQQGTQPKPPQAPKTPAAPAASALRPPTVQDIAAESAKAMADPTHPMNARKSQLSPATFAGKTIKTIRSTQDNPLSAKEHEQLASTHGRIGTILRLNGHADEAKAHYEAAAFHRTAAEKKWKQPATQPTTQKPPVAPAKPVAPKSDPVAEAKKEYKEKGVKAKAFKNWFGDWEKDPKAASKVINPKTGEPQVTHPIDQSKVTDENNRPVMVYHGTPWNSFDEFKAASLAKGEDLLYGSGFYFTDNHDVANEYRKQGSGIQSVEGPRATISGDPVEVHQKLLALARPKITELKKKHDELAKEKAGMGDWFNLDTPEQRSKMSQISLDMNDLQDNIERIENVTSRPKNETTESFRKRMESGLPGLRDLLGDGIAKLAEMPKGHVFKVYLNIRKPFDVDKHKIDTATLPENLRKSLGSSLSSQMSYNQLAEEGVNKSDLNKHLASQGYDGITHTGHFGARGGQKVAGSGSPSTLNRSRVRTTKGHLIPRVQRSICRLKRNRFVLLSNMARSISLPIPDPAGISSDKGHTEGMCICTRAERYRKGRNRRRRQRRASLPLRPSRPLSPMATLSNPCPAKPCAPAFIGLPCHPARPTLSRTVPTKRTSLAANRWRTISGKSPASKRPRQGQRN